VFWVRRQYLSEKESSLNPELSTKLFRCIAHQKRSRGKNLMFRRMKFLPLLPPFIPRLNELFAKDVAGILSHYTAALFH